MGKRSNFKRREADFYVTPFPAVPPLIPFLRGVRTFAEPCYGDGALVRHLESFGLRCVWQGDISTGRDALAFDYYGGADLNITNPPYVRKLMHRLIVHFQRIAPTWLLLESDWALTQQAGPFLPACSDIVAVGRLKLIAGTEYSGMQNFAWYRFDARHTAGPVFRGYEQADSSVRRCERCGRAYVPLRSTSQYCSGRCRTAACRERFLALR